jgi:hypothetical protein
MTAPGFVNCVSVGAAVAASLLSGLSRARPKSRILIRPSGVTRMFSGFRSRWTIPFSCAAARAWAISTARPIAVPVDIPDEISARRDRPSMSSIAMKSVSFSEPIS